MLIFNELQKHGIGSKAEGSLAIISATCNSRQQVLLVRQITDACRFSRQISKGTGANSPPVSEHRLFHDRFVNVIRAFIRELTAQIALVS